MLAKPWDPRLLASRARKTASTRRRDARTEPALQAGLMSVEPSMDSNLAGKDMLLSQQQQQGYTACAKQGELNLGSGLPVRHGINMEEGSTGLNIGARSTPSPTPALAPTPTPTQDRFEEVPPNWLQQLIRSLPYKSRRAMFVVSKRLAKCVLGSAPEVTLRLESSGDATATQVELRQRIISHLLSGRSELFLEVGPAAWRAFPLELASKVRSVTFTCGIALGSGFSHWDAFTNLQRVCLSGKTVTERDVSGLCDAVKVGKLPQLHSLEVKVDRKRPKLQILLHMLAPQLHELTTSYEPLLRKVSQLPVLPTLNLLGYCTLTRSLFKQLCGHPTLRHVSIYNDRFTGDHSKRTCMWEQLTVRNAEVLNLVRLPLATVQQVNIVGRLSYGWDRWGMGLFVTELPSESLTEHAHKVVCKGDLFREFELDHLCKHMAPLLQHMQGVETLTLRGGLSDGVVISMIWKALPTSVSKLVLSSVNRSMYRIFSGRQELVFSWERLWDDLPEHVSSISLCQCDISTTEMLTLVRTVPSHVSNLVLILDKKSTTCIADLHVIAPKHLKLDAKQITSAGITYPYNGPMG